jgi:hypothetical protein
MIGGKRGNVKKVSYCSASKQYLATFTSRLEDVSFNEGIMEGIFPDTQKALLRFMEDG